MRLDAPDPLAIRDESAMPAVAVDPTAGAGGMPPWWDLETDPVKRITEAVAAYETESALVDAYVGMWSASLGGDPNLRYRDIGHPTMQDAVNMHLRAMGIEPPRPSKEAREYMEWAAAQAPGADGSVDAYVAWQAAQRARLAEFALTGTMDGKPPTAAQLAALIHGLQNGDAGVDAGAMAYGGGGGGADFPVLPNDNDVTMGGGGYADVRMGGGRGYDVAMPRAYGGLDVAMPGGYYPDVAMPGGGPDPDLLASLLRLTGGR